MESANRIKAYDGVIELFGGAGGLTWGWKRAGFHPLVSIDSDTAACRTHELNFGPAHSLTLNRDLKEFGPDDLEQLIGTGPRKLLAVVGGPPCQGWSKAGRGKLRSLKGSGHSLLNDPRNSLYQQFVAYVDYFRPPIYVMENVAGMLRLEGHNVAEEVSDNFAHVGYRTTYAVVNARWFGVPQDRKRLIFIGVQSGLELNLNAEDLQEYGLRFRSTVAGLPGETDLRNAISDLPEIPARSREDPQLYQRRRGRISRYVELMRSNSNGLVTDHVGWGHNAQDLEAFELMPEGGIYADLPDRLKRYRDDIFHDKYRRLRWRSVSGTITAHLSKDCFTHIHPGQPRTISIREAARIQSFPDDFRFSGNIGERFRQIGNAVPPLMAWGIAEYVKERLSAIAQKNPRLKRGAREASALDERSNRNGGAADALK
jgi:DNA (cytosine-5)-methyltransferase 1